MSSRRDGSVTQVYARVTLVLKCLGLYPLVTDPGRSFRRRYRALNCCGVLFGVAFYGYLLLNYSLDMEAVRMNTQSVIVQRMLDAFHVVRYVTAIAVPATAMLTLEKSFRMLQLLEECSAEIVQLLHGVSKRFPFGVLSSSRFFVALQVASVACPVFCGMLAMSVVDALDKTRTKPGLYFRITRFLYFCGYVQLWLQPTIMLLLLLTRFGAVNKLMR